MLKKRLKTLKLAKEEVNIFGPILGLGVFILTAIISFLEWVDPGSHLAPFWEGLAEIGITSVSLFFFILAPFVMGFIAICCGWILDVFIMFVAYLTSEKFRTKFESIEKALEGPTYSISEALMGKEAADEMRAQRANSNLSYSEYTTTADTTLETNPRQQEKDPKPTGEKKFCSQCGEKLTVGAKFCSECGVAV